MTRIPHISLPVPVRSLPCRQTLPRCARSLRWAACALGLIAWVPEARPETALTPPTALEVARQLNQAFIEVTERVSAAVVVIRVVQAAEPTPTGREPDSWFDKLPPQLRKFFEERGEDGEDGEPGLPPQPRGPGEYDGQGSGIVIREDGYILTNNHVIENAERITVRFKDGREFRGRVQGRDPKSDIAVIKIDAQGLPVVRMGNSENTRVGEFAIAIGAPFELDYSVTFGHVSAKGRSGVIPTFAGGGAMDQDFIQTDASINPGNSGGPLVNLNGEVIGINTLIRGMNRGIGFAIPIDLAREVADQLIAEGRYSRAWLGVGIRDLREFAEYRRILTNLSDGVVVESIQPTGPAAKSNLRPADVIVAVNDQAVRTTPELRNSIRAKAGKEVTLAVVRGERRESIKVTPEPWPDEAERPRRTTRTAAPEKETSVGITVKAAPEKADAGKAGGSGVLIAEVAPNTAAAARGLRGGDTITAVDHRPVNTPEEFQAAIGAASLQRGILIHYSRRGAERFEILRQPGAD